MEDEICIKNLTYSYNGNLAQLNNLNFNIKQGECVVLIGKSGCGKSSFTRVINGLIPHFYKGELRGKVYLKSIDSTQLTSWKIGKLIGNVFQDPRSQFFANEVAGEIAFGCENEGLSHEKIVNRVYQSAKDLNIDNMLNESIYTLSYGMRQKVAIASVKAVNPDIYIFDEPSANLDISSTKTLRNMIKKLKTEGKTIIVSEHRLYYLKDVADTYYLLENGSIIKKISAKEMDKIKLLERMNYGLRENDLTRIEIPYKDIAKNTGSSCLEVKGIKKQIGKRRIIEDISFKFDTNEIIALIGNNATGKSTFGKIIAGLIKESGGEVILGEKSIRAKQRISKIWYVPQDLDSQLFGEDLVDELITGLKKNKLLENQAEKILKELDLIDFKDQHPATLSGGQKQRLALGVAIMHDAKFIVLDEPTSGLDGINMLRVSKVIRNINKEGIKFLIISHDAEFIVNTCDRIIKLNEGRIVEDYYLNSVSTSTLLQSMGY